MPRSLFEERDDSREGSVGGERIGIAVARLLDEARESAAVRFHEFESSEPALRTRWYTQLAFAIAASFGVRPSRDLEHRSFDEAPLAPEAPNTLADELVVRLAARTGSSSATCSRLLRAWPYPSGGRTGS